MAAGCSTPSAYASPSYSRDYNPYRPSPPRAATGYFGSPQHSSPQYSYKGDGSSAADDSPPHHLKGYFPTPYSNPYIADRTPGSGWQQTPFYRAQTPNYGTPPAGSPSLAAYSINSSASTTFGVSKSSYVPSPANSSLNPNVPSFSPGNSSLSSLLGQSKASNEKDAQIVPQGQLTTSVGSLALVASTGAEANPIKRPGQHRSAPSSSVTRKLLGLGGMAATLAPPGRSATSGSLGRSPLGSSRGTSPVGSNLSNGGSPLLSALGLPLTKTRKYKVKLPKEHAEDEELVQEPIAAAARPKKSIWSRTPLEDPFKLVADAGEPVEATSIDPYTDEADKGLPETIDVSLYILLHDSSPAEPSFFAS